MQELLILTSPPASGKTYWISSFKEALYDQKLLVISPLRALADECRAKWGETISVMTPEEWLGKKTFHKVVIFDEFHLFFYWGDTFRTKMWEMFYEISQTSQTIILLTATLPEFIRNEISHFHCQFDKILWIDLGNQTLKYKPTLYLKAPSSQWIIDEIEAQKKNAEVKLIFCKYREEVFNWEKKLSEQGFKCVSCVGGESKFMASKLKECPRPDFIIATTVLSHGVNLPVIRKIFFLYQVGNLDFWIQMVARGGRRGEDFEVYALEKPQGLKWNLWQNLLWIFWFNFRRKILRQNFPFLV